MNDEIQTDRFNCCLSRQRTTSIHNFLSFLSLREEKKAFVLGTTHGKKKKKWNAPKISSIAWEKKRITVKNCQLSILKYSYAYRKIQWEIYAPPSVIPSGRGSWRWIRFPVSVEKCPLLLAFLDRPALRLSNKPKLLVSILSRRIERRCKIHLILSNRPVFPMLYRK